MAPEVVRLRDRTTSPWQNRAGTTQELFVERDSGGVKWRVSIARIAEDAGFSTFEGFNRLLMPLDDSLRLSIDGDERAVPRYTVSEFPGEAQVAALGVVAPVSVLNVMTRRDAATATVELQLHDEEFLHGEKVVLALDGTALLPEGTTLRPGDAARVYADVDVDFGVRFRAAGHAAVVTIRPSSA